MISIEAQWWPVEVLTQYQVVAGQMQVRGRFLSQLNDPEPIVQLREISTTPLLAGAPRLQGIGFGQLNKAYFSVVRTLQTEPPAPDAPAELVRRFMYFQGAGFNVKGQVEFPAGADATRHAEMLFKNNFFAVADAAVSVVGSQAAPMSWPLAYVNKNLMIGLYLG